MTSRALYVQDEKGRVRRREARRPTVAPGMSLLMVGFVLAVLATSNLFIPNLSGTIFTDPTVLSLGMAVIVAGIAWITDRGFIGRPHLLVLLLAATMLPGVLNAAPHEYGQSKILGIVLTLMIVLATTQIFGRWPVAPAFLGILAVFGVLVAGVLLTFGDVTTFGGRSSVLGLNPISLGRMAGLGALLCVLMALWGRGWWRLLLFGAGAFSVLAAIATGSRGPVLAAAIAVVFALLVSRRPASMGVRLLGVGALLAASYVFLQVVGLDSSSRILSQDSSGRESLWLESWAIALSTPGGLGFGGLYGHITLTPGAAVTGYIQYSHNILLEMAVEGGWIALAGLLVVLVISFRRLLTASVTRTGALLLAVWVFSFVNALVSSDLVGNRLLWVMIAVGLGLELFQARGGRAPNEDEGVTGASVSTWRPIPTRRWTRFP